jgi:hypothetical protein
LIEGGSFKLPLMSCYSQDGRAGAPSDHYPDVGFRLVVR